jgi:hypothetical protein
MFRVTALAVVSIIVLMFASSLLAGEHEIGVFVGDTRYDGTSALTLGAGYEYQWSATAGIGLLFEYVTGDRHIREYVFGLPFYIHPYGGLRLCVAPLYISEKEDDNTVARGAVRAGAAYAIEAGNFSITPQINFDFIHNEAYTVYGLGFGYRF